MKVKRQLAMIMAAMMALGSPLTMFAQEIDATGGTGSGSADTNFSVDAETLGGGLVVLIPDEIVLEYNEGDEMFEKTAQITAKGFVEVDKHLEVSVPTAIEYALENFSSVTAAGTVTFGTTVDDNQVENWTQAELKTKSGDSVVGVSKDITVEVPESNVLDIGTYRAVISFNIDLLGGVDDATLAANFTWESDNVVGGLADGITLTNVVIPATNNGVPVDEIAMDAFSEDTNIASVKIPNSVTYIGDNAFDGCTNLATIDLGNGVETISAHAFKNITAVQSITLPDSLTQIKNYAFMNDSNLASVTYGGQTYTNISDLTDALTGAGVTVGTDVFTGTALTE